MGDVALLVTLLLFTMFVRQYIYLQVVYLPPISTISYPDDTFIATVNVYYALHKILEEAYSSVYFYIPALQLDELCTDVISVLPY